MTEDDLLDRMTDSTRWTHNETADVKAIITLGRRRRRHRAQLVAGAVSTVLVLASGVVIQLTQRQTPPALNSSVPTATTALPFRLSSQVTAERLLRVFAQHVDPVGKHVQPWANTDVWGTKTHVTGKWIQGNGQGMVLITLGALPGIERLIKCFGAVDVSGSMRGFGPWAPEAIPYDCAWRMTSAGSVITGTAEVNGVRSYMATYYRGLPWPRVTVQVLGQPSFKPSASDPAPVTNPDVTIEKLIEAAIDPAMSVDG